MRILITNIWLKGRSGTEIVTIEMARGLARRGHDVVVFSPEPGDAARDLRSSGIAVTDRLDTLNFRPEIVHGNHSVDLVHGLIAFPYVPGVFVCHNPSHWMCSPPDLARVQVFVAVDRLGRERIARELPRAREHIRTVYNAVDLARFVPRGPLPRRPRRALMLTKFSAAVDEVRAACAAANLELDVVGSGVGNEVTDLPERLLRADIVFASARMAIEAMAVGCAVVVVDARGLAGLAKPDLLAAWRAENFGKGVLTRPVTADALGAEIAGYDADAAARVAEDIRRQHDLEHALGTYEAIYRDAIARHRPVDVEQEAREMSRLMRLWLPTLDGAVTNPTMADALRQSEADRAARLEQVHTLTRLLAESEQDRAARLEHIHALTRQLAELEQDRALRLEHIHALTRQLAESEQDRAVRLEHNHTLTRLLAESEQDRALRLEHIHALTRQLAESEQDRAARLEGIRTLTRLLEESEKDRAARLEQIQTLHRLLGR